MTSSSASPASSGSKRRSQGDWRLILRVVPYARRYRRELLTVFSLLIPLSVAGALQPILVGQAISAIRSESQLYDAVAWLFNGLENLSLPSLINSWVEGFAALLQGLTLPETINLLTVLLLITVVIRFGLQSVQGYLVQKVGQEITADIRNDLFAHVLSLAVRFFDRTPVGQLITRLTNDVEALGDVFSTGAVGIVSDLFSILVIVLFMFLQQWQLALMLVLLLIPVTGLIIFFQHRYRSANYKAREELSALNSNLQENIMGISIVQLFRRESYNAELFRQINQRYVTAIDHTIFYDSAVSATLEWIAFIAVTGVLWIGGVQVVGEALTLGTLSTFILYSQRLFFPLQQLAEKFTAIQAGLTAVERINDLMNQPVEIRDPEHPQILPVHSNHQPLGEVKFADVSFAYKEEDWVLKDLDFCIHPGEKVAIVGPTGAGKSSIIRLLCRLYEISKGQILVDGVDVRDLPQAELRRHVGVILQDGFIFAGDVKSNISLGEEYSLEAVKAAAEQMNVAQFIEALPDGYDTILRERGTNLSGGQKQLLAFARAAIRNPRILVLDEATASLDVGTEAVIQEALERLLEGRTAIIIAHRLSTIRNVDRILVLNRGHLAESGSHDQLMEQDGLYASLYRLQLLGQQV
ncbi:ABC transporter ATP-binding protein [Acaryochloris marina]|uniref:ABC transporter, transmembrane region protein n=1 Tax=Acaryochloris marina (strain MBIC 11017) TaxID=329726 RepID=B0C7A7_ACAM1|nr:ABC transporter ATP-binding protein [Acaryochloris marina]ABW30084.1 ABC transporter, transmembrane region protein [Acaryochloris marina MBIC11017]BDM78937.1 ABC transporter ATP-binding protein [Acaryochloris marina MBIC10699]